MAREVFMGMRVSNLVDGDYWMKLENGKPVKYVVMRDGVRHG